MGKTILVVDDDRGIQEAMKYILEDAGYTVQIASQFKLPKKLPDLIILDILLSGVDGIELAQKLKKQPTTQHIPLIIFSAHPQAQSRAEAVGVTFVPKPFDMYQLLETIKQLTSDV